jgi:hypothetical protein
MTFATVTRLSEPRASHGHYTRETVHATHPGDNRTLCGVAFRLGEFGKVEWVRHWGDKFPTCVKCAAKLPVLVFDV